MAFYWVNPEVEAYDDRMVLSFDLPGRERKDIKVKVECGQLRIRASHEVRRNLAFTLDLRQRYDKDKITAGYRDGVLKIELPIRPEEQGRAVEVS